MRIEFQGFLLALQQHPQPWHIDVAKGVRATNKKYYLHRLGPRTVGGAEPRNHLGGCHVPVASLWSGPHIEDGFEGA